MPKTIAHTIDMFRSYIKQTSDDSVFSDSFLYDVLLSARNDILPKELGSNNPININSWKTFCIAVCPSDFIPCDCITVSGAYTVLKSKQKIPSYLYSRSYRYIQLRTIDNGIKIPYKDPIQGKYMKHKQTKNKMWFTIINDYLYIVNHPTNTLKVVLVHAILEDPRDALLVAYCDNNGNINESANCYDARKDTFSIPLKIENAIMQTALKLIGVTMQMPDDSSNNTESVINKY